MSTFKIDLSMKNIFILKHSLEKRIESDKSRYEQLKEFSKNNIMTDEDETFVKEHEEHVSCLNALIEEIKCVGYMHGRNIFGSKYKY